MPAPRLKLLELVDEWPPCDMFWLLLFGLNSFEEKFGLNAAAFTLILLFYVSTDAEELWI